jgi:delta 1-pyrroline-5-carboxylate dehydrogenase
LSILVEGAIATALVRGDPTVARPAKAAAQVLLAAAGIPEHAVKLRKSVSRRA